MDFAVSTDIGVNEYVESPLGVKAIAYVGSQGISEDVEREHDITPHQLELEEESTVMECVEYNVLYHNANGWSEKNFLTAMNVMQKHNIDIFVITEHKQAQP